MSEHPTFDLHEARTAIEALIFRYASLVDAGDLEAVAELLQHAQVSGAGTRRPVTGVDDVRAMYSASVRRYDTGTPLTHHMTTNLTIEFDADGEASATSSFLVLQAVPGQLPLQPIIAGHYHDRFERHASAWRFAARRIVPHLMGDLSQHLLHPPAPPEPTSASGQPEEHLHRTGVVQRYLAALERRDPRAIVELYAEAATLEDPVGSVPVTGRDAIAEFYERAVTRIAHARLDGPVQSAGDMAAFALDVGLEGGGGMRIIDTFRFDEDGKIAEMRAIWHPANAY